MTALPALTERDFMRQVTELAELFGWQWAHFRPAMTTTGWRTAVSGPLGKGWPDLVLVRPNAAPRRLAFVELKRDGAKTQPDQDRVLDVLDDLRWSSALAGVETYVWRPEDWPQIETILR